MFQNFDATTRPEDGPSRVSALRVAMASAGVDVFLIPRADAHRGENVAPCDERLAWLTGFTGSAGLAAVSAAAAVIFVDGRYTLQVRQQTDSGTFQYLNLMQDKPADWARSVLPDGGRIGIDPMLHTRAELARLNDGLPDAFEIVEIGNLVDEVWADRPDAPRAAIVPYGVAFAGEDSAAKRARLGAGLVSDDLAAAVITLPDSIAWLLNIRGGDIARTPVARAFAILRATGKVDLFVTDVAAVGSDTVAHLGADVAVAGKDAFMPALSALRGRVAVDKDTAPIAVCNALTQAEIVWKRDPCILPKAQKNAVEIQGSREAHLRDGIAMVEFLTWLSESAPNGGLSEIDVVEKLEDFRRGTNSLQDISFESISGAGAHAAIPHYRVTRDSNAPLHPNSIYLIDSGGQYLDGTTDITRTIAIGTPPDDAKLPYTLVLKGMIALSRLHWPAGLAGRDLDAVARQALWAHGMDYDHGTGHGVGAYLGVHEGPAAFSRRSIEPILTGMILSNEPGYYREGGFGIRIENLIVVNDPATPPGGDRDMLSFETLTFVPIDKTLIDRKLMTSAEVAWLNNYHQETFSRLSEHVSPAAKAWLVAATSPI